MIKVLLSEKAIRLLRILRNWRHNSTLDELVSELAQEELPISTSSPLRTGGSAIDRSDSILTGLIPPQSPIQIVSDWVTERDSGNTSGYQDKLGSLTKLTEPDGEYYNLVGGSTEDYYFTKIIYASVDSVPVKKLSWAGLLRSMLVAIKYTGVTNIQSDHCCWVNGRKIGHGWEYARELNMSIQGTNAFDRCKQVADLALRYNIPIEIKVTWGKKGKYPYRNGLLRIEPRYKTTNSSQM